MGKHVPAWLQVLLGTGLLILLTAAVSGGAASSAERFFMGVLTGICTAAILVAVYLFVQEHVHVRRRGRHSMR
jgi:hypothetical protein